MRRSPSVRWALRLEGLEARDVPATPLTPAQVRHAYGFDQVSFSGGTVAGDGTGQTIAIVDAYDDPNIAGDLQTFDSQFGIPAPPSFTKIVQSGTVTDAGWSGEIALDVEWAHAIAPKASIILVEARSSSYTDLLAAVDTAASQPGVSAVSMSWGGGEFSSESSYDYHFTTPSGHSNVTFVASSGDNGAPPSWPAASPKVLAVGGTSLTLTSAGDYGSETGWSGSGGGVSRYESKPTYQGYVATLSSKKRSNPDVAYNADPNTGVYVYDSVNGGWFQVGGTSAGAPQWAALVAVADQGRALAGKAPLDGATQTLYATYKMAQTAPTDFHDITSGNNGYAAKVGYDGVTGIGSPLANKVVGGLVGWTGTGSAGSLATGTAVPPLGGTPPAGTHAVETAAPLTPGLAVSASVYGVSLATGGTAVVAVSPDVTARPVAAPVSQTVPDVTPTLRAGGTAQGAVAVDLFRQVAGATGPADDVEWLPHGVAV